MNAVPAVDYVDLQTPSFDTPSISTHAPRFAVEAKGVFYLRDFTADGSGSTAVTDPYNYGFLSSGHYYLPTKADAGVTESHQDLAKGVASTYALAGGVLSLNPDIDDDMDTAFSDLFGVPSEKIISQ